jgi:hypothetical protein
MHRETGNNRLEQANTNKRNRQITGTRNVITDHSSTHRYAFGGIPDKDKHIVPQFSRITTENEYPVSLHIAPFVTDFLPLFEK